MEHSGLAASSAESSAGFGELQEDGGEERRGRATGLCGVLAAGTGPPVAPGVPSASLSSMVSDVNCRESSADVDSSMEDSSASGARGGAALWRVTPSSPFIVSTMRPHDRPKYVKEMTFPGKMIFPAGKGTKAKENIDLAVKTAIKTKRCEEVTDRESVERSL